ncbi:histidine kinase [Bordetella petrii]|uniref:histidine kinase n=1 Tax=Bordetella petrii TaxID=94624 RepID=UPI0009DC955D|nr:histidine kinase [Bordetella petrii]
MNRPIPSLKVLVVEDEDSKLQEWDDAINAHNADAENTGFYIEIVTSKSVADAKLLLDLYRLDAVVVDLRLQVEPGVADNNDHGNELVRHILAVQPLGVVVYTGQRAEADIEGYGCGQVRVMDKGDGLPPVFAWLAENKDVFLRLRGAKGAFNRETAKVFFQSIWPRWSYWTKDAGEGTDLTEVVARHVVAHVHDSLLTAGGDATHAEEAYFVPPLKSRLDTGDLVDYEGRAWVVVTPRCDLAHEGKVETVLLAACEDISAKWDELSRAGSNGAKDKLRKLIQHDGGQHKRHFLHPMIDVNANRKGPWLVQFDNLKSLPAGQAIRELAPLRFASLAPLFVPSLVERFGAYFSRIGTPDYSST